MDKKQEALSELYGEWQENKKDKVLRQQLIKDVKSVNAAISDFKQTLLAAQESYKKEYAKTSSISEKKEISKKKKSVDNEFEEIRGEQKKFEKKYKAFLSGEEKGEVTRFQKLKGHFSEEQKSKNRIKTSKEKLADLKELHEDTAEDDLSESSKADLHKAVTNVHEAYTTEIASLKAQTKKLDDAIRNASSKGKKEKLIDEKRTLAVKLKQLQKEHASHKDEFEDVISDHEDKKAKAKAEHEAAAKKKASKGGAAVTVNKHSKKARDDEEDAAPRPPKLSRQASVVEKPAKKPAKAHEDVEDSADTGAATPPHHATPAEHEVKEKSAKASHDIPDAPPL